jgi:multicomponent Na+:H+ antiporter subunit D
MAVILAALLLPLAGAGLSWFVAVRWRPLVAVATTTATLVAAVLIARRVVDGGRTELLLGGPERALGVLVADGLSSGLILLSATIALATAVFALLDRRSGGVRPSYWPLSSALLTGLHGLFLAGDLLTAYLMLELVAVSGAAMVAWGGSRQQLVAGTRYFYAELMASVTFLVGTVLVWSAAGTVVIADLGGGQVGDGVTGRLGFALITVGLLLKVPVVPLHFWLPAAHALAPSAVSPLLSALVVKSAFVVLLRVWVSGVPELATSSFAQLLGAFGAVAVIWGGLAALRAQRVKELIAYSTVAQLGLLLVAVPMIVTGSAEAWIGGVLHAIAHALPKAAVLLAVGLLARSLGGDTVDRFAGAAVHRPLATFVLGVAGLSLVGLPPTGGFVAKWHLIVASITTGQWWWAATIVIGSLLTAAYMARLLQRCFMDPTAAAGTPDPAGTVDTAVRVRVERRGTDVVAFGLASSGLLLGLYPNALLGLLGVGAPLEVMAHG